MGFFTKVSILIFCLTGAFFLNVNGQERCLSGQEADSIIARIDSPQIPANKDDLRKELLKMRETREKLEAKLLDKLDKSQNILIEREKLGRNNLLRVCQMIKENGWLTKEAIKQDGVEAVIYIISNNREFDLQLEMLKVLAAAANKELIPKNYLAPIVDNIRIGRNLPQIFGTQAKIKDNVVYIYPLLNENRLDEWRKSYNLPPMATTIREMEDRFMMPVLKMSRPAKMPNAKQNTDTKDVTAVLGVKNDEDEILEINTKLVNLNVQILNPDLTNADNINLKKEDFAVYENGQEQQISFFSNTDQPFDLVLLLDFSGSTVSKQGLIKKAAERFVQLARPSDRIAVVAFTDEIRMIQDLTTNRQQLIESIKNIKMSGGSRIWDALKYTYDNIIDKESRERRSAVVFMTDGLDGSQNITYADLIEKVRQSETTIFPVFLDPSYYQLSTTSRMAEKSMSMLAQESGGQLYPAKNLKDLVGIYEQIVKDLSRVYSISYEPTDETRDGSWRELKVKIKSQPNLIVRSRQGYYAN